MPIMIGDKIYNILFTLDVIDRLQTDTQMPMTEILEWALNENNGNSYQVPFKILNRR